MTRLRLASLLALAACVLAPTAAAAGSPGKRLASIAKTAREQHSVHYVSVQKEGTTSLTIVADVAATAGIQRITYRQAGKTGHLTVIVVSRTAYLRGDPFVLRQFLGFPAAAATKFAGTWLRARHTSQAYDPIAEDATFASALDDLDPAGSLSNVKRTKIEGRAAVGVRATSTVQGQKIVRTIWGAAKGKPLLVGQFTTAPGVSVSITYSGWNEPVHVSAPLDYVDVDTGKSAGNVA